MIKKAIKLIDADCGSAMTRQAFCQTGKHVPCPIIHPEYVGVDNLEYFCWHLLHENENGCMLVSEIHEHYAYYNNEANTITFIEF